MSKKIFISYRRSDTAAAAGRLYDRFCRLLGRKNVFLDIGAIEAAENFEEKIQTEIGRASAVLIMIGKDWMVTAPGDNKPRLLDPNDHVRAEVKAALAGKGLVMPVLVDNAAMPEAGLLPEDIRAIAALNAPPLRYESFDADVDRIARKVLGVGASEMLWDSAPLSRRIWSAAAGGFFAGVALLALALAHHYFLRRPISTSIGEAQTTLLIMGTLVSGLIAGLIYGSRRRPL